MSRDLPDLRVLGLGGEATPPDLARRWAPHVMLFNLYGLTEATVYQVPPGWGLGFRGEGLKHAYARRDRHGLAEITVHRVALDSHVTRGRSGRRCKLWVALPIDSEVKTLIYCRSVLARGDVGGAREAVQPLRIGWLMGMETTVYQVASGLAVGCMLACLGLGERHSDECCVRSRGSGGDFSPGKGHT